MSTTCVGVSASNGRRPVRSWKRITPHGVEIAARVDRIAAPLLGRHVVGRAADDAGARDVGRPVTSAFIFAQAEVDDLHEVAAGPHRLEDDVLRLEIAVDDAEVVRLGERREHLAEHVDDPPGTEIGPSS